LFLIFKLSLFYQEDDILLTCFLCLLYYNILFHIDHSINTLSGQKCYKGHKNVKWTICSLQFAHPCTKPVVPKLFLIVYHLWVPYCHHVPTCSRKTQSTKEHLIKSLENQDWHKYNMIKIAVKNYSGHFSKPTSTQNPGIY